MCLLVDPGFNEWHEIPSVRLLHLGKQVILNADSLPTLLGPAETLTEAIIPHFRGGIVEGQLLPRLDISQGYHSRSILHPTSIPLTAMIGVSSSIKLVIRRTEMSLTDLITEMSHPFLLFRCHFVDICQWNEFGLRMRNGVIPDDFSLLDDLSGEESLL